MNFLLIVTYVFLILFNIIGRYINMTSYIDEAICLISLIIYILIIVKNHGIMRVSKYEKRILKCILILLFIGIISVIKNRFVLNFDYILKDILLTFKFFITYISLKTILQNYKSESLYKNIVAISKCIIIIIFLGGIVNLFLDVGMGGEIRFGIRSYKFLYSHYTYLVFNVVILISIIETEKDKDNVLFFVIGICCLILSLRTKAIVFAASYILVKVAIGKKEKIRDLKKYFKIKYIVIVLSVGALMAYPKVKEYISWGYSYNLRNALYVYGIKYALEQFPVGTGFATFSTNISVKAKSPLYNIMNNAQGLSDGANAVVSDVFWPSIYTQFGFIGAIIYMIAIINIIKDIINNSNIDKKMILSQLIIIGYLIISSFAEAAFSNDTAVFAVVYIILINSMRVENDKEE